MLEQVGPTACRWALPLQSSVVHNVFCVSILCKYEPDPCHVISYELLTIRDGEQHVSILGRKELVLQTKVIPLVRVQ